jgi:hypothetical protein
MNLTPDIVSSSAAGRDGEEIVPYENIRDMEPDGAETDSEAESQGPDEEWRFWDSQIRAGLIHERRWRSEAMDCENLFFGPDNDPGSNAHSDGTGVKDENRITDKVALIHSNIEVLKPLLYSETPQPVVRRRFRGDGKIEETDLMAAEVGQRLATYLLDTEPFDDVMEALRDDWLIAGRGAGRALYKADIAHIEMPHPDTGEPVPLPVKQSESVCPRHAEWRRLVLAPSHSWEQMPWIAFETPMTRTKVEQRFGEETAAKFSFNQKGLVGASAGLSDDDRARDDSMLKDSETGEPAISPFDTAMVWEIWDKERRLVIWWSPSYRGGVIDREEDPLGLEEFWPMPKPLLATTKGQQMTPRPSIKYYEQRANEIDVATKKLKSILNVLSVSGLFPGKMTEEVKKLLDGENSMIPVESWIALMEKGGTNNIIQWLPLQYMIQAIQALITLREQSKQAMFEASGVSDIMRAQGDPNETATAQQIKGRYAGLRLTSKQRQIAIYARDLLRIMVEIALEHFDAEYLADITSLDLPLTEMDRQMMIAEQEAAKAQYAQAIKQHQQAQQLYQMAQQAGMQINPPAPPPEEPKFDRIPETSFELVLDRLKSDYGRKISVTIETSSTILADEQADKDARIEFLKAFTMFVSDLMPLAGSGAMDFKTAKELMMFGIRGFPKSRTLESMIASLPDEPQGEPPEDTQVTVAKIRAEVDKMLKEMDMADREKERQHETRMKGTDLVAEAAQMAAESGQSPQPVPAG